MVCCRAHSVAQSTSHLGHGGGGSSQRLHAAEEACGAQSRATAARAAFQLLQVAEELCRAPQSAPSSAEDDRYSDVEKDLGGGGGSGGGGAMRRSVTRYCGITLAALLVASLAAFLYWPSANTLFGEVAVDGSERFVGVDGTQVNGV